MGRFDAPSGGGLGRFATPPTTTTPTAPPPAKTDPGLFGFHPPKIGLGQLFKELGGGVTGLVRLGSSLAPGGQPAGQVWSQAGKGFLSSMIGTAEDAVPGGGVPILGPAMFHAANQDIAQHLGGPQYAPQTMWEKINKRGILPAAFEDTMNTSIGGAVAGKAASLGDVGRAGAAADAAERAATLAESQPGTSAAARAATRASKLAAKAPEAGTVDPGAVASRAQFISAMHGVAHPYQTLFNNVIRPITRSAFNANLPPEPTPAPEADVAGQAAQAPAGNPVQPEQPTPAAAPVQQQPDTPVTRPVAETAGVNPDVRGYYVKYGAQLGAQPPTAVGVKGAMDADAAGRIADAYLNTDFHNPDDPKVQAAYQALIKETGAQFKYMTDPKEQGGLGIKVDFVDRTQNPYNAAPDANAAMRADVADNGHLYADNTAPDESHPLMTPEQNTMFRAVHDFFGHAKAETQFDRGGEEVAYQHHAQMFSPLAREALATETRGQNTVLNYSADNIARKAAGEPAQFPEQKVGVLPKDMVDPLYGHRTAAEATADGVYLGGDMATPAEMAATARASTPIPDWAQRVNARLPEPVQGALAGAERWLQSRELRAVYGDRRRLVEASRQSALQAPPVQASIDAAQEILANKTLNDGTPITRQMASDMVGAEINRRLTGVKALVDKLQGEHSRQALAEVGALKDPIPEEAWTPELEGKLQRAADLWRAESQQRYEALTGDRLGDKGLDQQSVKWTRSDQRLYKQIQLDQRRLAALDVRRGREAEAAGRTVARADDFIARQAEQIDFLRKRQGAAVAAFDESRMPKALPKDPAGWEPFVQATAESGGGTFDPRAGIEIPRAFAGPDTPPAQIADGWAVSAIDAETVPAEKWAAVNPTTGATFGAEALHRTALDFQDLIAANPDVRLGTWIDDGKVYVDLSQHTLNGRPMARDEALLLGAARKQLSIFDLTSGDSVTPAGRPDLASQFVKRMYDWKAPTFRERRALELRDLVKKGIYSNEEIDSWMNAMDATAWSLKQAGKVANPDDAYKLYTVAAGSEKAAKALAKGAKGDAWLLQLALPSTDLRSIWDEANKTIANGDEMRRWYIASHDAVEARWRGQEVTLLNGDKIDAADLVYDLLAATSVNTQPLVNLGNALHGVANMVGFTKEMAGQQAAIESLVEDYLKTPGEVRSNTELFQRLTQNSHMYTIPKQMVFDILSGNTLDKWTPDSLQEMVEKFGRKTSKAGLTMDKVPQDLIDKLGPDRAFMEYYGGNAWAKLLSFRENLRDPLASQGVTLDVWMARLFGLKDWLKPGDYSEYAGKIRDFADELSKDTGSKVMPHEVQALFWAYAKNELTNADEDVRAGNRAAKLNAQDFGSILAKPNKRLQAVMDELSSHGMTPGDALLQKMGDTVKGALLTPADERLPSAMRFFQTADATTLVHEHGHLIRQILPKPMLDAVEAAYGVTDHNWTRPAEERFADEFVQYLSGEKTPVAPHLVGAFNSVRDSLGEQWRYVRGPFFKDTITPEGQALFDHLLDPPNAGYADLGIPGLKEAEQTLAQRAQLSPRLGESQAQMYGRGVTGGKSLVEVQRIEDAIRAKAEGVAKAQSVRNRIQQTLTEHTLPADVQAAALRDRSAARLSRLTGSLDSPSLSRVPAVWQPLYGAVSALTEAAKSNPALATELEDIPKTLSGVMDFANEHGFDPVHVRSFTNAEVQRLVFEAVKLGKPGRDIGQVIEAGTRKARAGAFARTQSIEALAAAQVEVAHEVNTNALVDYLEANMARPIPESGIPKGFQAWDPLRSFIMTGEKTPEGNVPQVEGFAVSKPTKMIPSQVAKALGSYQRDYHYWAANVIGKVTNPWRALVLTWSPRWYVNHILGHVMLATADGVKLGDWVRAWESYKANWADASAVTGRSAVSELGEKTTIIPRAGGFQGLKDAASLGNAINGPMGAAAETARQVSFEMRKVASTADNMSRAAVYFAGLRRGMTAEAALQRAFTAMIDFNDLTPFERQAVRSIVPFYAWQKGVMKAVARFPIDHPISAAIMFQLGKFNEQQANDMHLPWAYHGVVDLPGLGWTNTKAINPFLDSGQLAYPQGIAAALNPFVSIAVRNAFGAPQLGFTKRTQISDLGFKVPDTSPAAELGGEATGLPQARFAGDVAGTGGGGLTGALRFLGLPVYDPAALAKIQARMVKNVTPAGSAGVGRRGAASALQASGALNLGGPQIGAPPVAPSSGGSGGDSGGGSGLGIPKAFGVKTPATRVKAPTSKSPSFGKK